MKQATENYYTDKKIGRNEIILEGQKLALELAVKGNRLSDVLDALTLCVERQSTDRIYASILLLDKDGKRLVHGSAPHLPAAYNRAIEGSEIGACAGSCGTAAFTKKEVVVTNIATDPLWKDYKHLALPNGLAACWSTPILSRSDQLLATFAIYYTKPQPPSAADRIAVELLSRTAGIVIEWFSDIAKKRRAEEALKKTDQHLKALMTATTDVIYRMSADWETMWTLYGQNFLEDTSDAIVDWRSKYLLPEDRKMIEREINKAIETNGTFQLEHRVIQADGAIGWTFSRAIPILDDEGRIREWYGVATDVTERKRAEQALKESEKQFRDFSNNIQNLAWMAEGDGWIYWYNQRWYDYTGTTFETMKGWGWTTVHHPDHLARTTEFIRKAWNTGNEWELTFPLRGKNGEYRWFLTRAYPIKNEEGKVIRWIGTNTDVNEKLMIQQQLQQSEDRLRQVSDFMPQIVWSTDAQGNHDFFNKRWNEFTGLSYDESKGDQWIRVVHPDDIERIHRIWQRSLQTGALYEAEFRVRRKDGEYRWILARAMPLRQSNGAIERWFGTSTDIHDQKTMAQNLEILVHERTKELKRSNEDLQQFAHVSSHDLKEPVRKIMVFANLISDQYGKDLPEEVKTGVDRIKKSAKRIAEMIEGVLLYSALEGSSMTREDIDLNTIIADVALELELVITEKNVQIRSAKLPVIRGVPTMIYQLFYNLINNSIKFSDDEKEPVVIITSELIPNNGRLYHRIMVEDNGIGFNNKYAESIFTTFTRLHSKDSYEGSGLGLALCKKIVERHGGSISASGVENVGAKFLILLPA
jgi:PAS domain S-box-containing protein